MNPINNDKTNNPIPLNNHVHKNKITAMKCSKKDCSKNNQTVTYFEIDIHIWSGDSCGSYSLHCELCGKDSSKSFYDY